MSSNHHVRFFLILLLVYLTIACTSSQLHPRNAIAKGVDLRILPLGDSITFGEGSSDGNGYRLALSNLLTNGGNKLNYIGSVKSGTMANNENEGHGGFEIVSIGATGHPDYPDHPNVVLLMAGTNDIIFDIDTDKAPVRLIEVVLQIVAECPDAAVLVATLLPLLNPQITNKMINFNSAIPGLIWDISSKGAQVALVDMGRVTADKIHESDGIHPTGEGYELIAAAWYDGIVEAGKKGWIKKPVPKPSRNPLGVVGSQESKPGSQILESGTGVSTWTPAQVGIYVMLFLVLVVTARKGVIFFLRRYRS